MGFALRPATIAAVTFAAALCGVFVGREVFRPPPSPGTELHRLLHDRLDLDSRQRTRLDELEHAFALRRRALELELRADNARLAAAIQAEHGNGPLVAKAVDQTHHTMGQLQKETLAHIFAMRAILRPDQAAQFDRAVVQALTDQSG